MIPKDIAELINIEDSSKFLLDIKNTEMGKVLEYSLKWLRIIVTVFSYEIQINCNNNLTYNYQDS